MKKSEDIRVKIIIMAVGLFLLAATPAGAQMRTLIRQTQRTHAGSASRVASKARGLTATSSGALLRGRIKQCGGEAACLRILAEYGAMFVADATQITLPPYVYFHDEGEVQRFQKRVGKSAAVVNGIRVELQTQALRAYLQARDEAEQHHLSISPRGTVAARRSYADTVKLWRGRVEAGLKYWVRQGRVTSDDAAALRSLPLDKQVPAVLALEEDRVYFGNGFNKSILQSVAAPGASQHNAMLALDIEESGNQLVREIMARHGWFQTVENDEPHFTYLGVGESALATLGLRRINSGGRTFWLPRIEIQAAASTSATPPATDSCAQRRVTISAGVNVPHQMEPLLKKLSRTYYERSGRQCLHITDAYRSAGDQAAAMHHNIVIYGEPYVLSTYGSGSAVREVVTAYERNRGSPDTALKAMTAIIREQIGRGIYISKHLLGNAFDIRLSSANLPVLLAVVRSMGGRVLIEIDHYHVEF